MGHGVLGTDSKLLKASPISQAQLGKYTTHVSAMIQNPQTSRVGKLSSHAKIGNPPQFQRHRVDNLHVARVHQSKTPNASIYSGVFYLPLPGGRVAVPLPSVLR